MKLLYKLEKKFGRFAIPNLINYIVILLALGSFLGLMTPAFYQQFLMLDVEMVLKGQVWRLFTFLLEPSLSAATVSPFDILFLAIKLYLYYLFGHTLENAWGSFRFNLYLISGILFNILAAFLIYFTLGWNYPIGLEYVYQTMFFAFAALNPNMQFLLFFVIPIKVKWLAYLDAFWLAYSIFNYTRMGAFPVAAAILVAIANFLIFFFATRNYKRMSPREYQRKKRYKMQMKTAKEGTRHKCTICGRTNEDDETLEFRYCSKCEGNYEYCMEHLFTHQHVHK